MDATTIVTFTSVGASLLLAFGAVVTAISAKRKAPSEATQALTKAASNIAESYQRMLDDLKQGCEDEIEELRQEITREKTERKKTSEALNVLRVSFEKLQKENEELRAGITLLCGQLESEGKRPLWKPRPSIIALIPNGDLDDD